MIYKLAVAEEYCRQDLGKALMEILEQRLRKNPLEVLSAGSLGCLLLLREAQLAADGVVHRLEGFG